MIQLFEHPLSPYAQKVKIALREKGIDFEATTPTGVGAGLTGEAFQKANPRAEVPALIDEGFAIFDSRIILDYIEDKWPKPALLSEDARLRARSRMIEEVVDTQYEAINWGIAEIRAFGRAEGDRAETMLARAGEQIAALNLWLEGHLGEGTWFNKMGFGRADLAVLPYVAGATGHGFPPKAGSPLSEWFARAKERMSVEKTLAEAAASAQNADLAEVRKAIEAGLFKRQYRDHRLEWMMRTGGLDVVIKGLEKGDIRFSTEIA